MCRQWSDRYKLIPIARSKEVTTALADEFPDAHALPCDVAHLDAWDATLRRILEEFGQPKRILINTEAAAWVEYNTLSLDQLDNSFDVNAITDLLERTRSWRVYANTLELYGENRPPLALLQAVYLGAPRPFARPSVPTRLTSGIPAALSLARSAL